MTGAHAASLHFEGRKEAAKKRLQKLKDSGLIAERPRRPFEPAVIHLTRKGFLLLEQHGILAQYPAFDLPSLEKRARVSELTIRHELDVMDVKAAFHQALRDSPTFSVAEFCTWPRLHEFVTARSDGRDILVKPDGFLRIHEREADGGLSEHTFFIEVDRSTETQDTLLSRIASYLAYYKSGGFAVAHGAPRSAYKEFPFRVLVVLKSAERRNNAVERSLSRNPPVLTQAHFTTLTEVLTDPLGAIWLRPTDYQTAMPRTSLADSAGTYRRDQARDNFVEQQVPRVAII